MDNGGKQKQMTNKEALEALLKGKKITTQWWLDNNKIKTGVKSVMPKYIYFDFDKDGIVSETGRPLYLDTTGCEYVIYEDPLLSEDEKKFIWEVKNAMLFDETAIRVKLTDDTLLIQTPKFCFSFTLKNLIYDFCGLELNKEYSLKELGIEDDD